jgi:hypothetical protein
MDYLINFLLGVAGSLIASILFLYYILTYLRPQIKISPVIAHYKDLTIPGERRYYFKMINLSRYDAFDLRFRVCELIRIPAGNGKMHEQRKDMRVRFDHMAHVPKFRKIKDGETFAPHALIVTCLDDLLPILDDDNKCVELQVTLRHGLTGLARVFQYEYGNSSVVKNGIFDFGNHLTIPA